MADITVRQVCQRNLDHHIRHKRVGKFMGRFGSFLDEGLRFRYGNYAKL